MSTSVFLGRQPIFDRKRRTYAYELLCRNGTENLAFFRDPDDATRRVLEVAMLEWGFDRVVGDRRRHHEHAEARADEVEIHQDPRDHGDR